jgi:catechol 2,3-dioxygenase-like lactoylglutathione lyase family enzyme
MKPIFEPGENIAVKVPAHEYDQTVSFYQDILGLERKDIAPSGEYRTTVFKFGDKYLWVDRIPSISQAEVWLEVTTDDAERAATYLAESKVPRRDDIERLPEGFKGFWIAGPSNIIHLVTEKGS